MPFISSSEENEKANRKQQHLEWYPTPTFVLKIWLKGDQMKTPYNSNIVELTEVTDSTDFMLHNQKVWQQSSNTWLNGEMSHLQDLPPILLEKVEAICAVSAVLSIADFGCGEGWCQRTLYTHIPNLTYIGIDFNPKFFDHLNDNNNNENVQFVCADYSRDSFNIGKEVDLSISSFSLFEIVDLKQAIANIVKTTCLGGHIIVFTIDRIWQLIDISSTMQELYRKAALAYSDKDFYYNTTIRSEKLNEQESYLTITHSVANYINQFLSFGTQLIDCQEALINNEASGQSICYSILTFRKR